MPQERLFTSILVSWLLSAQKEKRERARQLFWVLAVGEEHTREGKEDFYNGIRSSRTCSNMRSSASCDQSLGNERVVARIPGNGYELSLDHSGDLIVRFFEL